MDDQLEHELQQRLDAIQAQTDEIERKKAIYKLLEVFWPIANTVMCKLRLRYRLSNNQYDVEMEDIFDRSIQKLVTEIHQFTMDKAEGAQGSTKQALITWFAKKCRLEYAIQDFCEKLNKKQTPISIDKSNGDNFSQHETYLDQEIDGTPRLGGLDHLVAEWQKNSDRRVVLTIAAILEQDPEVEFKVCGPGAKKPCKKTALSKCHLKDSEQINCRTILKLYQELENLTDVSRRLEVKHQSLEQRYKRHCLPHIRELVIDRLGYDPSQQ